MKRAKDFNKIVRRRSNTKLTSWVVFCLVMTATFAVCVTVTLRTHDARSQAESRYERLQAELLNLNATLGQPRMIENIAGQSSVNSAESLPEAPISEQQATLPLIYLLISYLGAVVTGYTTIRVLIALSRTKVRRGPKARGRVTRTKVRRTTVRERDPRATRRQALLLVGCLVLASGFIFAVRQQMMAVDYGYRAEALRREREELLDEQRRLRLALAESSSPAQLEQAAREVGMRPTSATENNASSAHSLVSAEISAQLFTSVSWFKVVLLMLLGGFTALLSSGLLTRIDQGTIVIKHAPGRVFCSVVDFMYSPKTVRETFEPIIADWRLEYFEALSRKRMWKARWICVRYYYHFIMAMGLSKLLSFHKVFTRAGK